LSVGKGVLEMECGGETENFPGGRDGGFGKKEESHGSRRGRREKKSGEGKVLGEGEVENLKKGG